MRQAVGSRMQMDTGGSKKHLEADAGSMSGSRKQDAGIGKRRAGIRNGKQPEADAGGSKAQTVGRQQETGNTRKQETGNRKQDHVWVNHTGHDHTRRCDRRSKEGLCHARLWHSHIHRACRWHEA
jgi:hypothetical protein